MNLKNFAFFRRKFVSWKFFKFIDELVESRDLLMGAIGWQSVLFSLFRLLWRHLPIVLLFLLITDSATAISHGSIPLVEESNSTLLSDNSTDATNGTVESSPPVQMKFQSSRGKQISKDSWAKYMDFTGETIEIFG